MIYHGFLYSNLILNHSINQKYFIMNLPLMSISINKLHKIKHLIILIMFKHFNELILKIIKLHINFLDLLKKYILL